MSLSRGRFLNLPNYISVARIAAVPIIVLLMMLIKAPDDLSHYLWNRWVSFLTAVVYAFASVSDMLDGFLARRYKISSDAGKFFDPLADKLLNLSTLIMLVAIGRIPAWLVILILSREMSITMLRSVAASEGIVISASKWGKYKNAFGSFGTAFLILYYPWFGVKCALVGWPLLIVSVVFSLGSGIHYLSAFIKETRSKV